MAKTDPNDFGPGPKWTVQGFLNGVRSAFGLGGSRFLPPGGGLAVIPNKSIPAELRYAQASIQNRGSYQTRMSVAENKLKMWRQAHLEMVEAKLRLNFHPKNWARMTLMPHTSTNLLDRVVRDLSITYETPPHRYLESDEPEPKKPGIPDPETEEEEPEEMMHEEEGEHEEGTDEETDPEAEEKPEEKAPPFGAKPKAKKMVAPVLDTGDEDIDALADLLELEGSTSKEETPFDKWIKHSEIDALWETVEWYARFLPCVWVRPYVRYADTIKEIATDKEGKQTEVMKGDPKTAKLEYIIYTPDLADVVVDPNNPTVALAFWYWSTELDERGDMVRRVNFWNKEVFVKLDEQWKVLFVEPHKYGMVPVVAVRLGKPVGSYYLDGAGDDLYEGTLELCVLRTIQNARARDSGFKQLVISGAGAEDIAADQVMGGPTPIYTNDEGSANVLDMAPDLQQWTDLTEKRGMELSAKYGISGAEYKAEGAPQSGFAKKLDRDKILKENKRTRKYFEKAEQETYKLTCAILKVQPVTEIGVLPDEDMRVDFSEPSFTEDPKVQSETDGKRLKLNIDSIIDILKRENPDLNETELVKLAHKKKKINDAFITTDQMKLVDLLASEGKLGAEPAAGGGFGGKPGGFGKPAGPPPPNAAARRSGTPPKPPFGGAK